MDLSADVGTYVYYFAVSPAGGSEHGSRLDPPIVVRNGTNTSVVLDCAYTLPPGDKLIP